MKKSICFIILGLTIFLIIMNMVFYENGKKFVKEESYAWNEKEIYEEDFEFEVGKNNVIKEGKDITIFSTGSIISEVLEAREKLVENNINAKVVNISTIKPIDETSIIEEIKKFKTVHNISLNEKVLVITYKKGKNNLGELIDFLKENNVKYNKIFSERPSLNDVFLFLTGKELRD